MKITCFLPLFLGLAAAHAATLNVTTTADSGAGSLRAQIAAAAGGDTVAITATGTITLTTGEIAVTGKNLIVAGPGANSLTITTNATTRAFKIVNAQCTISGLTFNNCRGLPGDVDTGGAIAVDNFTSGGGTNVTTITDCTFTNNQSGWGGAVDVFNGGLVLARSTFAGNSCNGLAFGTNGGGGALSLGPTVASTITNCTFSGNSQNGAAVGQPGGGAIYNYGAGFANPPAVTTEHCTFVGNVDAAGAAGAIRGNYTASYHTAARLKNCLFVNNQAPVSLLKNFAGNPTGALTASYASLGGNVTDEAATSATFMSTNADKFSNAALAPSVSSTLALNGGVIATHAITRGSPAQRTGVSNTVATDQRGAPRHATPDAGAFELIEPEISVSVAATPLAEGGALAFGSTPFSAPLVKTITITNAQTSVLTTGPLTLAGVSAPAGYAVSSFPAGPLANGQSATFTITLTAAATGLSNSALTFTGNDSFNPTIASAASGSPNQHTLNLTGLVTDTADHWRTQNFGPGATNSGNAADDANPAGDGLVNLLKYSLGLNPLVAYPPGTATASGFDSAGHLTMTVAKNPAATDVHLAIEVAGDLASPTAWSSANTTIDQDTATSLKAHDNTPLSSGQNRFIRLKVTRP
ncbi:MAG: hypothetical protein K8R23_17290 [Chthoniobacter sp.]|nr:hypothetical protein [Chthoniobacter sp.]